MIGFSQSKKDEETKKDWVWEEKIKLSPSVHDVIVHLQNSGKVVDITSMYYPIFSGIILYLQQPVGNTNKNNRYWE